jgi:nucleoside-diphosphate-sugar epimerase
MQTICLRPPWIWVPEPTEIEIYNRLITEYPKWRKNLWAYIHVADVALAVRQVIESGSLPLHDCYFICARDTWTLVESRKLLDEYFPETKRIAPDFSGTASFISSEKARRAFGFSPRYSWRDIVGHESTSPS